MKESIHPAYHALTVKCVCGAVYATASTRDGFSVDVCAACHPFYTGKQKSLTAKGRVDRFRRRYEQKTA